jgi:uncharacterized phage protein (TIGR01671 family)
MRPIKFRAWNKKIKAMGSALPLKIWTDDIASDIGREKYLRDRDNIVLMQFTDLRDKTGKEIYEGDVVQEKNGNIHKIEWGGHWNYAGFGLSGKRKNKEDWESDYYWDALNPEWAEVLEVIGNIYENPDWLRPEGA